MMITGHRGRFPHHKLLLLFPDDSLEEMNEKYALIFHRDFPPMKVYRLKWWQSPMLKKRHSLPPPELPTLPPVPDIAERPDVPLGSMHMTNGYIDPDFAYLPSRFSRIHS